MEQNMTAIKIGYKGEIHRIRVDLTAFKFEDLQALFEATFNLTRDSFVVQYKDGEGDVVNVKSTEEYEEACRLFTAATDSTKSLRFTAVPTTQVVFQQNVAEPILKVIEQLVQSLNEAMEKVKREQWAAKAQENARAFATKAQENAGEWASQAQVNAGVWSVKAQEAMASTGAVLNEQFSKTGDVLSEKLAQTSTVVNEKLAEAGAALAPIANKTVEESKAAFEAAKKSLNDIEFDKIKQALNEIEIDRLMKDASDGVKSAADVAAAYAQNLVNELNKLKQHTATDAVVVETPVAVPVAAPVDEVVEAAPAEPTVQVVVEQAAAETPAEAEWEEVQDETSAAPSPEESKWAAQLALVREVFPDANTAAVIDLLEAAKGDVHVVLNQLVDL
ncbi:hypothetical protein LEN26_005813 [Aphanomyces euteiches]|nr:hypothetical protein AeMF1_015882 [Aphanomyces euteiches]KAH9137293.1 hypothetical protein LEN26_005813 [Aphanomyces euteiches]KAH9195414.1 hypothetical protein AeNC1_002622 [Aphanomyces euteiches]